MFDIIKAKLEEILPLRNLFLKENNFQIRYNAYHERGWTDSYFITHKHEKIGYGATKGKESSHDRDTIFEFYLLPPFRNLSVFAFAELLHASEATFIESQSNDFLLTSLLYQYAQNINTEVVLFKDNAPTDLKVATAIFRKREENEVIFMHQSEPVGNYVLEIAQQVVATGGFLLHYNIPFADLYMEVEEKHRRNGLGSLLIQELKKQCYLAGRVPAARCHINNMASRATLLKAGLEIAGFMLWGQVKPQYGMSYHINR